MQKITSRLLATLQSKGNLGKSTECLARIEWLNNNSIQWQAYDLDDAHRSIFKRYPEQTKLLSISGPDAAEQLLKVFRNAGRTPVQIVDIERNEEPCPSHMSSPSTAVPRLRPSSTCPGPFPGRASSWSRCTRPGVNPVDWKVREGRLAAAFPSHFPLVPGWDAAGVVQAVGPQVSLFKPGDAVYYAGDITRPGANAELHVVDERIVGHKPKSLDWAEAAALPLTALVAPAEHVAERRDVELLAAEGRHRRARQGRGFREQLPLVRGGEQVDFARARATLHRLRRGPVQHTVLKLVEGMLDAGLVGSGELQGEADMPPLSPDHRILRPHLPADR